MSERVSTRRQHTKDLLVEAAITLFAEKSIEAASVEEICERAGFTRGAFYSNFSSREDLCLEILRRSGERAQAATTEAFAMIPAELATDSVDEVIAKAIEALDYGLTVDDQSVLVRAELRHFAIRNPEFGAALLEAEQRTSTLANEALTEILESRGARFQIPVEQLILTLDAYCERIRLDAFLAQDQSHANSWRPGMEAIVRALLVLPEDR